MQITVTANGYGKGETTDEDWSIATESAEVSARLQAKRLAATFGLSLAGIAAVRLASVNETSQDSVDASFEFTFDTRDAEFGDGQDGIRSRARSAASDRPVRVIRELGKLDDRMRSGIRQAMNGRRGFSSIEIATYAEVLGVDVHWLLTGQQDPNRIIGLSHARKSVDGE